MTKQADVLALAAFLSNWSANFALSTTTPAENVSTANQPQPSQRGTSMTAPLAAPALPPSGRTLRRRSSNYSYDTMPSSNDGTTETESLHVPVMDSLLASSSNSLQQGHHHRNGPLYHESTSRQLLSPSSVLRTHYGEASGIPSFIDISSLPRPPFDVGARWSNGEQTPQRSSTSNRSLSSHPPHLSVGHPQAQVHQDGETLSARAGPLGEGSGDSEATNEG